LCISFGTISKCEYKTFASVVSQQDGVCATDFLSAAPMWPNRVSHCRFKTIYTVHVHLNEETCPQVQQCDAFQ